MIMMVCKVAGCKRKSLFVARNWYNNKKTNTHVCPTHRQNMVACRLCGHVADYYTVENGGAMRCPSCRAFDSMEACDI
jgi:hypothetical protein